MSKYTDKEKFEMANKEMVELRKQFKKVKGMLNNKSIRVAFTEEQLKELENIDEKLYELDHTLYDYTFLNY